MRPVPWLNISLLPMLRDGEPVPYKKPQTNTHTANPNQTAQRPLTHLPISTHNPPPNEQTKERATAPRGYRPSLYERLRIFGVFRGSPPKRVFRAGPKWLWLLSPQKVMPVRRGQAHRQLHFENGSVIHPNTTQTPSPIRKDRSYAPPAAQNLLRKTTTLRLCSKLSFARCGYTPCGLSTQIFPLRVTSPQFRFAKPKKV